MHWIGHSGFSCFCILQFLVSPSGIPTPQEEVAISISWKGCMQQKEWEEHFMLLGNWRGSHSDTKGGVWVDCFVELKMHYQAWWYIVVEIHVLMVVAKDEALWEFSFPATWEWLQLRSILLLTCLGLVLLVWTKCEPFAFWLQQGFSFNNIHI